ncbi:MAG: adenylate kinase [Planctomycetia bacterium]|nr:adenylate kinase [Planctomycetia bacterium]
MRLLFIGPPGAGKGTQAERICRRYEIVHISTGDMFREAIAAGTPLGREADEYIRRGDLVPDDVVTGMVMQRLAQDDCAAGWLLDGYPRTPAQAASLDRALADSGQTIDKVLLLEVPDEVLVERITGRRVDPATGQVYHVKHRPPPPDVAGRVVQRADDTEATFRARLKKYRAETESVLPFYESRGLLSRIDGNAAPKQVAAAIFEALG